MGPTRQILLQPPAVFLLESPLPPPSNEGEGQRGGGGCTPARPRGGGGGGRSPARDHGGVEMLLKLFVGLMLLGMMVVVSAFAVFLA